MNTSNRAVSEQSEEMLHVHSIANELDILVSNTLQMNKKRERDLERFHSVLSNVEELLAA